VADATFGPALRHRLDIDESDSADPRVRLNSSRNSKK
jgi:hypothetical protein